ncbi:MAG: GNAT family N-acetyltransferase [Marmoricola sp.]
MTRVNEFGQPIGRALEWSSATSPSPQVISGRHVRLEPLSVADAAELYEALRHNPELWTYLPVDAPTDVAAMAAIIEEQCALADAQPFVVRDLAGTALGTLSYLRDQPAIGLIEVGWVTFGPKLQRTPASTEAQYLLMRHALEDLGYRRYEWKCDSLNAPSRAAAVRLGFVDEGTWRNALVLKGRNRDTTWYSITLEEWPRVRAAFEAWLADDNFVDGRQRRSLASLR